jgi:hypothetical protein
LVNEDKQLTIASGRWPWNNPYSKVRYRQGYADKRSFANSEDAKFFKKSDRRHGAVPSRRGSGTNSSALWIDPKSRWRSASTSREQIPWSKLQVYE